MTTSIAFLQQTITFSESENMLVGWFHNPKVIRKKCFVAKIVV